MTDTLLVIPARYGSTRFPGKVLEKLDGKPLLEWVYLACLKSGLGETLIATESETVVKAAAAFGASAILTSASCPSGTDRVYAASRGRTEDYIINVQSDEPFIEPETLRAVLFKLKSDPKADIATACAPFSDTDDISDTNCVKAAVSENGRAIYFSRSPVPYHHPLSEIGKTPWLKHCGIYGYKKAALEKFVSLPPSQLERLERLEQLRALEAGMVIACAVIKRLGPAVDSPPDMARAREYLRELGGAK